MDIGKEAEQPVEYPVPSRTQPRREVVPETAPAEPVKEPARVSYTERETYARCARGN